MNYFGHAAVAAAHGGSEEFVLGAMLPDLGAMVGARIAHSRHVGLQAGLDFHLRTDAVFHQTSSFIHLNRAALSAAREAGVRRGPARAGAHIGIEMMIDTELIEVQRWLQAYLQAMSLGCQRPRLFEEFGADTSRQLRGLLAHLADRGARVHETDKQRLQLRLGRTLRGRPRLSPSEPELTTVVESCLGQRSQVRESIQPLLVEMQTPLVLELPTLGCPRDAQYAKTTSL